MRLAVLFAFTLPLCAQDKPAAKTVNVAKQEALREGALEYRVTSLHLNPGTDYFTLAFRVRNVSEKENVKESVWVDRFHGWKLVDDRGREYKSTGGGGLTPRRFLPPGSHVEWTFNLAGKPNPKAMRLGFTLKESGDSPEVTFQIPLSMLRPR